MGHEKIIFSDGVCTYKGYFLLDAMPLGWALDKTVGSPLHGYVFITNGKSVLHGQQRALLLAQPNKKDLAFAEIVVDAPAAKIQTQTKTKLVEIIDACSAKTVNNLARKKFEHKLLADIKIDLMICEIEGWDKFEYIRELQKLIGSIGKSGSRTTFRSKKYKIQSEFLFE